MEITGNIIHTAGIFSFSAAITAAFLLVRSRLGFLSNLDELEEEFEELWKRDYFYEPWHPQLINLSHIYRSLKNQIEKDIEVDRKLLESALKRARKRRRILSNERHDHLYYAAWKKFRELKIKL